MKTTVITIALAMMTVVAFGQENQQTKATDKIQTEEKAQTENKVQTRRGPYFVDKDNDGICDNYQSGNRQGRGKRFGRRGQGQGRCPIFIDKN